MKKIAARQSDPTGRVGSQAMHLRGRRRKKQGPALPKHYEEGTWSKKGKITVRDYL